MRMRRKKHLDERLHLAGDYLVDVGETEGGYNGIPFCAAQLDLQKIFGNEHPV